LVGWCEWSGENAQPRSVSCAPASRVPDRSVTWGLPDSMLDSREYDEGERF
jgi:hypothetical protein